jgi:hypothetical protein
MNAADILAATAEAYRSLPFYRDHGRVVTRVGGPTLFAEELPFQTAFARPDRFRFEYQYRYHPGRPWKSFVVWAHSSEVRVRWDAIGGLKRHDSLQSAIGAATGVSYGAARAIPVLLLGDEIGGRRPTDLGEAVSIGDDTLLDGVVCHRVSGHGGREESPRTLWIERDSFLIRRIEWQTILDTFSAQVAMEYEPAIGPVPDCALQLQAESLN